MKIAFRTDATSQIGTGHFMRCLTLAEHMKLQGALVRFVCRDLPAHLQAMLEEKGIEHMPLAVSEGVVVGDLAHSHWLPHGQESDAQATGQTLVGQVWDWLVVDHYALDIRWESTMRQVAKHIMVIDDLADRQHDCDMLLDQNYYADMQTRYSGKVPAQCQLLLGPRYALLREEFPEWRKQAHPRSGAVKNILVFFGGADADNYTRRAIQVLSELKLSAVKVNVVIGAQHPAREEIGNMCTALGYLCHVQTSRMAELMAAADLAIGAGGSASWERCCLGLPALLVALADNQVDIAQALDLRGASIFIGSKDSVNASTFRRSLNNLINNSEQLARISQRSFALVDGLGTQRVCQSLGY